MRVESVRLASRRVVASHASEHVPVVDTNNGQSAAAEEDDDDNDSNNVTNRRAYVYETVAMALRGVTVDTKSIDAAERVMHATTWRIAMSRPRFF